MTESKAQVSTSAVAKRRWAVILFVGAVALLVAALVNVVGTLEQTAYTADDFIVPGFLLIFGLMLLAASRAVRRPETALILPPDGPPTH